MQERRIIKRYQNRKLYDTQQSCYVTLDEIAQMIRGGDDLVVIDNKTKNDITHSTLTQLLFENEKRSNNPAPVSLLKEIVRSGDGSLSGFILSRVKVAQPEEREEMTATAPMTGGTFQPDAGLVSSTTN